MEVFERVNVEDMTFFDVVLEGVFTVTGDGFIDSCIIAGSLAEIAYSGWIVVEARQDPIKANPFEYNRMGNQHLT